MQNKLVLTTKLMPKFSLSLVQNWPYDDNKHSTATELRGTLGHKLNRSAWVPLNLYFFVCQEQNLLLFLTH